MTPETPETSSSGVSPRVTMRKGPTSLRSARLPCPECGGKTHVLPGSEASLVDGVVFRRHRCAVCANVFLSIHSSVPRFRSLMEAALRLAD